MPLVTLTCSTMYYPPDSPSGLRITSHQQGVIDLARIIPRLFADNDDKLHLEPLIETGNPGDSVQVDIKKFHVYSRNSVDIWIHIQVTEDDLLGNQRRELRDSLISIFEDKLAMFELKPSWALDIFFGPGHGCFTNRDGKIVQRW